MRVMKRFRIGSAPMRRSCSRYLSLCITVLRSATTRACQIVQAPGDDHVDGEAGFETLLACQVPDAAAAREDGLEHLEASAGLLEEREDVALAILDGDDARLGAAVLRFAYRRPSLVLGSSVEDRRRENAKRQALRAERQARAQPQARAVGLGKDVGGRGLTAGAEVEARGAL